MMRNALFSTVKADVGLKRSQFDLSKRRFSTFNQGELVPIYVNTDILAGDTFNVSTKLKIRSRTPLTPVLDDAKLDTYWFFVPYTQVWDGTKAFYGDSDPSAWIDPTEKFIPALVIDDLKSLCSVADTAGYNNTLLHSLWDHFGLPLLDMSGSYESKIPISALAFRAYKLIWNEWFRDENLQDAQFVNTSDTATLADYYPVDENGDYIPLLRACRIHDYFSSALPGPQKGQPVYIPLIGDVPVTTLKNGSTVLPYDDSRQSLAFSSGSDVFNGDIANSNYSVITVDRDGTYKKGIASGAVELNSGAIDADAAGKVQPSNLVVNFSSADLVNVNTLRLAVASQRVLERLARGGSRFQEFLRSFFGCVSPELAITIPQYLGGQTAIIRNNQVIQTSASESGKPLGQTAAFSLTVDAKKSFVKSFTQPGILMCLATVRVQHTYEQRIDKQWTRQSFFDFYTEPLSHLGERQVKNYELFFSDWNGVGTDPNTEGFGYTEVWNEYRYGINDVVGEMRPSAGTPGMRPWQYTDHYTSRPTLSPGWIVEPDSNIGQTLATDSSLADQFFGDFFFNIIASRVVSIDSNPGLLDHY